MQVSKQTNNGFTLIEMLVSLAIFTIVVTMSVGSILVLLGSSQQTQDRTGVIENMAFVLDSMTRDIRTGYDYFCIRGAPSDLNSSGKFMPFSIGQQEDIGNDGNVGFDCAQGDIGVSFIETGGSLTDLTAAADRRVAFFFNDNHLWRQIGNTDPEQMTSSGIHVHNANFYVTGSERLEASNSDVDQPLVSIFMQVSDDDDSNITCTSTDERCVWIQTTVTQRLLDI